MTACSESNSVALSLAQSRDRASSEAVLVPSRDIPEQDNRALFMSTQRNAVDLNRDGFRVISGDRSGQQAGVNMECHVFAYSSETLPTKQAGAVNVYAERKGTGTTRCFSKIVSDSWPAACLLASVASSHSVTTRP
ncbi:hypothetical protein SRHO_G00283730 [Serrasalmus rhombeus]